MKNHSTRMRIAYGVMGYGRGHAMRTMSVLPALMADHEVTVFAGGDAYDVLAPRFPTVRIPTIGYQYGADGTLSLARTLARNARPMSDLLFGGAGMAAVKREFGERRINAVISDSEAWTHRAAQQLGIPRISFDHVGIIAYCKPHFPPALRTLGRRDALGYRALMGVPQRILISSFYPAEPAYPQVQVIGPMLRDQVLATPASDGDYLLTYFNKGEHQYQPHIERTLRMLDMPVVIYGTGRRGRDRHLDFRAPSADGFVRDLAGCRAVLSTAGNQLIGEAIHFGKPILALPEMAFEQRLNASMVERMGIGMAGDLTKLTPADLDRFFARHAEYVRNMARHRRNGRSQAIHALRAHLCDLSREQRATRQRARPATRVVPGAF